MPTSLTSAVVAILLSRGYAIFLSILFTPILVRLLGPTQYGIFGIIISLFAIISVATSAGTGDAVRKFVSERTDPTWQTAVIGFHLRIALVLGVLSAVGIGFVAWSGLAASLFGPAFTSLFYLLAILLVFQQLSDQIESTLHGLQLENRSEPLEMLYKSLYIGLGLCFVYLGFGVDGVLYGLLAALVVVTVAGTVIVSRHVSLRSILFPPETSVPKTQMITYGINSVVFFLCLTSLYYVDILFLQHWETTDVVGYYKGAIAIAEVLWLAPIAVQFALIQRVSGYWQRDDIESIERLAQQTTRYVFLLTILLVIGLATLSTDFVIVYLGSDFAPATTPLLLLLPGVLGFALARPTLAINQARRSLRPLLIATGACATVNVVLNLLLIPLYGMIGAAIATSIGYGSLVVFQTMAAKYLGYTPFGTSKIPATLLTATVTLIVIVPLSLVIESTLLSLLVVPIVGGIVFAVGAISTGAIAIDDVEFVLASVEAIPDSFERTVTFVVSAVPKLYN